MLNLGFNEITDAILVHLKGDFVFTCVFRVVGIFPARSVSAVALGRPNVTCWNNIQRSFLRTLIMVQLLM